MIQSENLDEIIKLKTFINGRLSKGENVYIKISQEGYINSWYNKHVGKKYRLKAVMVNTGWKFNYLNFIVESGNDGTKLGYKSYARGYLGKGYDLVHSFAAEIVDEKL